MPAHFDLHAFTQARNSTVIGTLMTRRICTTDRAALRAWIPPSYSARRQIVGLITVGGLAIGALALRFAPELRAIDLLAAPVTALIGSFLEYLAHRFVMHTPRAWLRRAWEAHAGRHHHFYRREAPTWEAPRDIWLILFSPSDTLVLAMILAPPLALLSLVLTPGAWAVAVASVIAYFLAYELLHLLFHLPDGHALLALPGVTTLRRRHLRHHDLADTHANYGVSSPLWDHVFGTERGAGDPREP